MIRCLGPFLFMLAGAAVAQDAEERGRALLPRQNFNQTVVGNSALLATYDRYGTVLDVFWPTVGKYSNVASSRSAYLLRKLVPGGDWLDFPRQQGPAVLGTFAALVRERAPALQLLREAPVVGQEYVLRTNILVTRHSGLAGLAVEVSDHSPMEAGADALVRTFRITNTSALPVSGAQLAVYANLDLGEEVDRDRAAYDAASDRIVQENPGRRVACAVGASVRSRSRAVVARAWRRNAFRELERAAERSGDLAGPLEAQGDVDWALLYPVPPLPPGGTETIAFTYAFGSDAAAATRALELVRATPADRSLDRTAAWWRAWLDRGRRLPIPDARGAALYERSLLVLKALADRNTGAIIAGPTLNPDYRFAWPRDGTIMATAFAAAGHFEECRAYLKFLMDDLKRSVHAGREADWASRYQSDGLPYTGGQPFSDQVDDLGFVPLAIWVYGSLSGDRAFVADSYPYLKLVAGNVAHRRGKVTGLIRGVDYWEDFDGWYAPTQAIIASGMRALAHVATDLARAGHAYPGTDLARDARDLTGLSAGLKAAMLEHFWKEKDGFLQRTLEHNLRDGVPGSILVNLINVALHRRGVDAGVPMMVYPLGLFRADDPRVARSFERIEKRLTRNGGFYPGEDWPTVLAGNDPWVFWTEYAIPYLKRRGDTARMQVYLSWVLRVATPQGMLPERVFQSDLAPMSTTPLGWPHGTFIQIMHELHGEPVPVPEFFDGGRSK